MVQLGQHRSRPLTCLRDAPHVLWPQGVSDLSDEGRSRGQEEPLSTVTVNLQSLLVASMDSCPLTVGLLSLKAGLCTPTVVCT